MCWRAWQITSSSTQSVTEVVSSYHHKTTTEEKRAHSRLTIGKYTISPLLQRRRHRLFQQLRRNLHRADLSLGGAQRIRELSEFLRGRRAHGNLGANHPVRIRRPARTFPLARRQPLVQKMRQPRHANRSA